MKKVYLYPEIVILIFFIFGTFTLFSCTENQENKTTIPTIVDTTPSHTYAPSQTKTRTMTLTPTETRTLTETATRKVSTPTSTSDPGLSPSILAQLSSEPLVLYVDVALYKYYLQNILTGETWQIISFDKLPTGSKDDLQHYRFITWSKNGCEIILWSKQSIIRIDLDGNLVEEIYSFENIQGGIKEAVLNPDEDKIAYYGIGTNYDPVDQVYTGAYIDIVELSDPSVTYRISEDNKGDGMMKWSPDGEWLAYAAYDTNNILQVYISNTDGSIRKQLTRLTEKSAELSDLEWSPDQKKIIFIYDVEGKPPTIGLIYNIDQKAEFAFLDYPLPGPIYWLNSNIIVAWYLDIFWIDVSKDEIVYSMDDQLVSGHIKWNRHFEYSNLDGFIPHSAEAYELGDHHYNVYIYDPISGTVERAKNSYIPEDIEFIDWHPIPATFPGRNVCNP